MKQRKKAKSVRAILVYDKQKMFEFYLGAIARLRRDWDALAQMFMDKSRRDFLNGRYPFFAVSVSTSLTVSVYMGIAQLFDSVATFNDPKKRNLVLRRVIDDLAPPVGSTARKTIEADHLAMQPTIKLLKEWRNKVGAHRSLMITIELVDYIKGGHTKPHPIPYIPLMDVHATLQCLVTIMDILFEHVKGELMVWYDPAIIREVNKIFPTPVP